MPRTRVTQSGLILPFVPIIWLREARGFRSKTSTRSSSSALAKRRCRWLPRRMRSIGPLLTDALVITKQGHVTEDFGIAGLWKRGIPSQTTEAFKPRKWCSNLWKR